MIVALRWTPQLMAALQIGGTMDPKLALLFVLIGTVVGFSRIGNENSGPMRPLRIDRRWRNFMRGWRKL
jgi:hypothetical protein